MQNTKWFMISAVSARTTAGNPQELLRIKSGQISELVNKEITDSMFDPITYNENKERMTVVDITPAKGKCPTNLFNMAAVEVSNQLKGLGYHVDVKTDLNCCPAKHYIYLAY